MPEANLPPAINGTEQRLDVLLRQQRELIDEVRALRRLLEPRATPAPEGMVELREHDAPRPARKRR